MMKYSAEYERTDYCGLLGEKDRGRDVVLCGWVFRMRDLGGLIFVDLRDREGIVQCVFDESSNKESFRTAFSVRSEYVLKISGKVRERTAKNPRIPTGDIEVLADGIAILSESETPPFEISDEVEVNDQVRLKYRYLDLRRPSLQEALKLRHRVTQIARNYFDEEGFLEIETPILTKSTPEGARDYLVPSRVHPGKFYALPQSPQQYKQILMIAGFDRYMQIVRCFRDEDLRADRQPEFTQIDLEMSFVGIDDVLAVNEGFLKRVFKEILSKDISIPFPRIPWREAMDRFGSDKPDLRFGLEIKDISDIAAKCGFKVFSGAVEAGGTVRLINVPEGASKFTRKEIDALSEFVKTYRAKGLAWYRMAEETTSSFAKFLKPEETDAILERAGAEKGDLILIVADEKELTALTALGSLRCEIAKRLGLIRKDDYKLLWVTDFPLFEYSEEEKRYVACHHPFTAPVDEDIPLLLTDPAHVRSKAYDIVLNGIELGGGSIRIHDTNLQTKMFKALGFSTEETKERFGHLLEAFQYGAPPHGGLAYGLDRLCMLLSGKNSIRDVIAFPKVQNASELMMNCPDAVDDKQLKELSIKLDVPKKTN